MPRLLTTVVALLSAGIVHAEAPAMFVPVRAVLRTTPAAEGTVVRLPAAGGTLGLFVGESVGNIAEFRIDLNVAQDSDGDGVADNDADNAWHSSFRSGGTFPVNVRSAKGETQRVVALRVVGAGGEVSDARITVLFDPDFESEPEVQEVKLERGTEETGEAEEVEETGKPARIVADREVLRMGERFTLRVENAPDGTSVYGWDLQGDNRFDAQTPLPSILLEPDAPGMLPVRVTFLDGEGVVTGSVTASFMVGAGMGGGEGDEGDEGSDMVRIDALVRGLQVAFRPVPNQSLDLSELEPTWEFGDGSKSYLLEPTHAYALSGTYTVTLVLLDARSKQEVAAGSASVSVSGGGGYSVEERDGGPIASLLKPFLFVFRIALLVFSLLALASGGVFLFLFLAARAENVPIREVITRYREKLKGEVPTVELPVRPAALAGRDGWQAGPARTPLPLEEESGEMEKVTETATKDEPPPRPAEPFARQSDAVGLGRAMDIGEPESESESESEPEFQPLSSDSSSEALLADRPARPPTESPEAMERTPAWLREGLKAAGAEDPWQAEEEEEPIAFVEGEVGEEGDKGKGIGDRG